ncbi:Tad domain-containing protein [Streptomyces sp. NBC_00006]|uniref:TadE/TadG family type IV pilus assembly protein n=1 Tax=unclassified Streptomyces TaxID=2593676 RepID=UPI00225B4BBB|nr:MULTISPECIES: pilus assembly protein TadG-related protein [unclassified Streptomyces]MCX4834223.1 Tad domain-containing protein [Streptomyces sp. NBC_01016]MCX5529861.1 Tad domain-containing protein [Streptomyces sp. NBC_00006]
MRRHHKRQVRMPAAMRADDGQITAMVVVMAAALILFAGLVIDGGLALAGKVRAADTAQEAARSACQMVDLDHLRATQEMRLDTGPARTAALARATAAGDSARVRVTGDQATVSVTHHQPTQVLSLVGIGTLTTHAQATARIERGTTTPWDEADGGTP